MRLGWLAEGVMGVGIAAAAAHGAGAPMIPKQAPKQTPAQTPKQIKVPILNSYGQDAGSATFKTVKNGVKVKIELRNVRFGPHAVHIHENPICDAPDFEGAGPDFNPDGKRHGYLNPLGHHNGDFPAGVPVGEEHAGEATFVLPSISLDPAAPNSLFLHGGTSIVIHARPDDQKTDPSGDSGNRIACGVIRLPSQN